MSGKPHQNRDIKTVRGLRGLYETQYLTKLSIVNSNTNGSQARYELPCG